MALKLSIVTPLKKLVTDLEVQSVSLSAYKGELTVLEGHESLVSTLEPGILSYTELNSGNQKQFVVNWGYCEVMNDEISVLAESAESYEELDFERAKKSLKSSTEALKKTDDLVTIEKYLAKVRKAEARLRLKPSDRA